MSKKDNEADDTPTWVKKEFDIIEYLRAVSRWIVTVNIIFVINAVGMAYGVFDDPLIRAASFAGQVTFIVITGIHSLDFQRTQYWNYEYIAIKPETKSPGEQG